MSDTFVEHLRTIASCPVCASTRLHYAFSVQERRVVRCDECSLLVAAQTPETEFLSSGGRVQPTQEHTHANSASLLASLRQYALKSPQQILWLSLDSQHAPSQPSGQPEITWIQSPVGNSESNAQLTTEALLEPLEAFFEDGVRFEACVIDHLLDKVTSPKALLARVHSLLEPSGVVLVSTECYSAQSLPLSLLSRDAELSCFYFSAPPLESLLFQSNFREIVLSPSSTRAHPERSGEVVALCRAEPTREVPLLSLIVPVYNEAQTIAHALDRLLKKQIAGLDIELVIVESNSTDGTREIIQGYKSDPRVQLVLEEKARGKGHAVREGLKYASGDFILIQDADLEYDLEDYEVLLEPLLAGREAFILGARHGGRNWKIRQFSEQPVQAFILNFAHWGFTYLINKALALRLRDPFTMYKVFRRDCLYGLTFECNRFDFDWELLIKLVRKGYRPIEIPVNYRSRSFKEGKKISMFRDPVTWIKALVKYRFTSL